MKNDSQFRKVQITQNNPEDFGYDHDKIKEELSKLKSCTYWILCDEIGGKDGTYHTHIYAVFKSPVRFSTIKNRFPHGHIEVAHGTHQQNIDYVTKSGRWKNTEKEATSIPSTLEEWGQRPSDANGTDEKLMQLYTYIKEGLSNYEILELCSDYLFDTDKIDRVRLTIKQEEFKEVWRNLEVTFITGSTGLGKSRFVMEKYGYSNVFRITDYLHPYDTYKGEDIIVFEEFSSSLKIQDMLNYTDGYPLKLPCRYSDKIACYTKVYIISNLLLEEQYPNVRTENPEVYKAFLRRINKVMYFKKDATITYDSVEEYLHRDPMTDYPVKKMDF